MKRVIGFHFIALMILFTVGFVGRLEGQIRGDSRNGHYGEHPVPLLKQSLPKDGKQIQSSCKDGKVRITIADADLICSDKVNQFLNCFVKVPFVVTNCSDNEIKPLKLIETKKMSSAKEFPYKTTYQFETVIPSKRRWQKIIHFGPNTGAFEFMLSYEDGVTNKTKVLRTTNHITNSALKKAMETCKKCNGQWGGHGMSGTVGCLCRTKDGGQPCSDGEDCEGICVQRKPEQKGTSRFVCSEFFTVFGCHSYLPKGWRQKSKGKKLVVIPRICVD